MTKWWDGFPLGQRRPNSLSKREAPRCRVVGRPWGQVRGAIIHILRGCDCHLYEYPSLHEHLKSLGLPVSLFQGEELVQDKAQQRSNMEAFIEMVRG